MLNTVYTLKVAKMTDKKGKSESLAKAKALADAVDGVSVKQAMLGDLEKESEPPEDNVDIFTGLTERQKIVQRLALRKFSQRAIATALKISPALVNLEMKRIREVHTARGSGLDRATIIGETLTVYEEVEARAWELFHSSKMDQVKLKALETIIKARGENLKTLGSAGLLVEKAPEETKEKITSEIMQKLEATMKQLMVEQLINKAALSKLEEPTPPPIEAETVNVPKATKLEEPEPPTDD